MARFVTLKPGGALPVSDRHASTLTKEMKTFTTLAFLAFAVQVVGSDKIDFQTAKDSNVRGIALSRENRGILKISDTSYILLELIDASREGEWEGYTEACSISWTLITPSSIQTGTASGSIRYSSREAGTRSFPDSSFTIFLVDGFTIRWAYGSRNAIFLFPSPDHKFATSKVNKPSPSSPDRPESK